jgi:FkbM family methyltransferase
MLTANSIDLILDVGANAGHYARGIREAGYQGAILSFEPLSAPHAIALKGALRDPTWEVAPRMAIGAIDRTAQINVAANSTSSSILPMLQQHTLAAPDSAYVDTEDVVIRRLDGIDHPLLDKAAAPFLKIDTQGFEREVIEGAAGLMPRLKGIQVEMSLRPLYEGQALWLDLNATLEAAGFELWSIVPGFFDPFTGQMFQCDGIYFRPSAAPVLPIAMGDASCD